MHSRARIVHQTRSRLRLRVPDRRGDIPYFMDLYEDLRSVPGITDVVINPRTASVLILFPEKTGDPVCSSLQQIGLLPPDQQEQQPLGRVERFFAGKNSRATHVRTVVLAILIVLAIHQFRRGQIFGPALSVLWYAYDLVAAHKKEKALLEAAPKLPSTQQAE